MNSKTPSTDLDPVVAVQNTHADAEACIRRLSQGGCDIQKLSIIGKGYHTEEHAVGFYTVGDRARAWGSVGGFWGAIWGLLSAPAMLLVPHVGLVMVAGPFGLALIAALEGAVIVGGLSALAGALTNLGLPAEKAIKYEADIKAERFLVLLHGSAADIARARELLAATSAPAQEPALAA